MKAPLVYLASPYSHKDMEVVENRVRIITAILSELTLIFGKRVIFYSPIVHSHPIQQMINESPEMSIEKEPDYIGIDKEMIKRVQLVCFVKIEGWEESEGMKAEKEFCDQVGISYVYASWNIARVIEASVLGTGGNPRLGKHAEVPELARVELEGLPGQEVIVDVNG